MSDIYARDAADSAAAFEAMNEQTANFQSWDNKRPSTEELMSKAKATGFDPYLLIKCPKCNSQYSPLLKRCDKCNR